jgi:hypothetical protein
VKGGCGLHYPTIQGSPAFLNRSIYHARKSLTRLNIRISDICWMCFVQIRFCGSVSAAYRLWKFENLGDFSPPRRLSELSSISGRIARQKFPLLTLISRNRAKTARIWPILYRSKQHTVLLSEVQGSRCVSAYGSFLGIPSTRARDDSRAGSQDLQPRVLFPASCSMKTHLSLFARKFLCQPRADVCENLFRRGLWR